jgi:ribose transport system substrate-binding protein
MKLPFPGRPLAVAVLSSLMFALPLSAAHAEDAPKVALVMKSLANEFFRTMEDGAKDYQKAHPRIST